MRPPIHQLNRPLYIAQFEHSRIIIRMYIYPGSFEIVSTTAASCFDASIPQLQNCLCNTIVYTYCWRVTFLQASFSGFAPCR